MCLFLHSAKRILSAVIEIILKLVSHLLQKVLRQLIKYLKGGIKKPKKTSNRDGKKSTKLPQRPLTPTIHSICQVEQVHFYKPPRGRTQSLKAATEKALHTSNQWLIMTWFHVTSCSVHNLTNPISLGRALWVCPRIKQWKSLKKSLNWKTHKSVIDLQTPAGQLYLIGTWESQFTASVLC